MKTSSRVRVVLLAAAIMLLMLSIPARADLVVSVGSVTVAPGSTSNSLDVDLTNTGSTGVSLDGFSFGVSVTNLDINFTGADISTTAPYIFAGDSLFGPTISTTVGSSLIASDVDVSGGITVAAGSTVGLGRMLFDVSPTASTGIFQVTLAGYPTTSLSDPSGNNVPITTLTNGQIQIASSTVPESSGALSMAGIVLVGMGWLRRRYRFMRP